jgi:tetratricopeptide (TPR) repeat protein
VQTWRSNKYTDADKEEEFAERFRLNQLLRLLSQYGGTHKFPIALMYGEDDDDDDELGPDPSYPDYTRGQMQEQVIFLRPGYDHEKGEFGSEIKDVAWCLSNGFEEVKAGVWSGYWYWDEYAGEEARLRRQRELDAIKMKKKKAKDALIERHTVDTQLFEHILDLKKEGNIAFLNHQYSIALSLYKQAAEKLGMGKFLAGVQRSEKVKILSNQAECCLRLKTYDEAMIWAAEAIRLDSQNEKSLFRRAKAACKGSHGNDLFVTNRAKEDLYLIIRLKGDGAAQAQALSDEIDAKTNEALAACQHQI